MPENEQHYWQQMLTNAQMAAAPSVLYRPAVYPDGDQWCALYGEDLQHGVAGFGSTPAKACADFDAVWSGDKRAAEER